MNAVVGGASQRQGRGSTMLTRITIRSAVVTCRQNRFPTKLLQSFIMTHHCPVYVIRCLPAAKRVCRKSLLDGQNQSRKHSGFTFFKTHVRAEKEKIRLHMAVSSYSKGQIKT